MTPYMLHQIAENSRKFLALRDAIADIILDGRTYEIQTTVTAEKIIVLFGKDLPMPAEPEEAEKPAPQATRKTK